MTPRLVLDAWAVLALLQGKNQQPRAALVTGDPELEQLTGHIQLVKLVRR